MHAGGQDDQAAMLPGDRDTLSRRTSREDDPLHFSTRRGERVQGCAITRYHGPSLDARQQGRRFSLFPLFAGMLGYLSA
jgi:hypothetical protein